MTNIILIGFMGAGKTTLGKATAQAVGCRFVDTDDLIEETTGEKISDIFATKGEPYFRDLETQAVKGLLAQSEQMVVAVGGGLPVRTENRQLLKQLGTVIYLKADIDTLLSRLEGDTSRPKLQGGDLRERIESLMARREALYEDAAQEEVYTDEKSVEDTVRELQKIFLK